MNNTPCKGMNCGTTNGRNHSAECEAEHAAAIAGGTFVKPARAQGERAALTNAEIRTILHKFSRHMGGDYWSDTEFASLQDVVAFARAIEQAARVEVAGPAKRTDISKRLREYASNPGYSHNDYADTMRAAAEEIERYYTGMLNWKASAEAKDSALASQQPVAKVEVAGPVAATQIAEIIFRLIGSCKMDWKPGDADDFFDNDDSELAEICRLVESALASPPPSAPVVPEDVRDAKESM